MTEEQKHAAADAVAAHIERFGTGAHAVSDRTGWVMERYVDAIVVYPRRGRSSVAWLVLDDIVTSFTPTTTDVETVYLAAQGDRDRRRTAPRRNRRPINTRNARRIRAGIVYQRLMAAVIVDSSSDPDVWDRFIDAREEFHRHQRHPLTRAAFHYAGRTWPARRRRTHAS